MGDPFSDMFDGQAPDDSREGDAGRPDGHADGGGGGRGRPPAAGVPARLFAGLTALAALGGAVFAGVSTADFVRHLDRQVHAIHCSFVPGATPDLGESGCRTVMMSPYSSFFRTELWGGFPVSVWALAVFAFLAYRAAALALSRRGGRDESFFLVAATLLPVGMSALYGYLALAEVGATCKVCVGIYVASAACFFLALVAHFATPAGHPPGRAGAGRARTFGLGFGEGVAFVAALTAVYLLMVPAADPAKAAEGCGRLVQPDDKHAVMLHMGPVPGGKPMIDVLDPLCPACRAFEARLDRSGFLARLDRRSVLFPLDAECNWMVGESLHPGACAVSEAMLCAGGRVQDGEGTAAGAREVLDWAFKNQDELLAEARKDPKSVRARIVKDFPALEACVGKARARNKLTKGLRWMVANALPVLTPQAFIDGRGLCAEDTDLGLDYALTAMLAGPAPAAAAGGAPAPGGAP